MAGGNASESVAEGRAVYSVKNGQIPEASLFFCPFLNCLLNPTLMIIVFDFSNIDMAHDVVNYVENGWFELRVLGASGCRERERFIQRTDTWMTNF